MRLLLGVYIPYSNQEPITGLPVQLWWKF